MVRKGVRDRAEYEKWRKWHSKIERELKGLLGDSAMLEKKHFLDKSGLLDNYKPDVTWKIGDKLCLFEVEYYYNQDKIVRDIIYACLLGASQLVFIFSDKKTDWGNGEKRVKATKCIASKLRPWTKSLEVEALCVGRPGELREKLRQVKII